MYVNAGTLEAVIPLVAGLAVSYVGFKKNCGNPKWNFFRKFKWIGPLLIIFSLFLCVKSLFAETIDLEAIVNRINKKVNPPVMVDSGTRFDGARVLGSREIGYFSTLVNYSKDSPELSKILPIQKSMLVTNGCKNPSYSYFFQNGITVTMIYLSNDNQEVLRVPISASDCSGLN